MATAAAFALLTSQLAAQGDFVNFEMSGVSALTVARLGNHDYLLAANTDDNSVEVYDTWTNAFVQRIPVGLGPVTVRWVPQLNRIFTANNLGDSVSAIDFSLVGGQALGVLKRTVQVGDAPVDVLLNPTPGRSEIIVLLGSPGRVALLDPSTLAVGATFPILTAASFGTMKEPRRIAFAGSRSYTINLRGDTAFDHPLSFNQRDFRFSLDRFDWTTLQKVSIEGSTAINNLAATTLGSTCAGMAVASDGRVFVVGGMAHNEIDGSTALMNRSSGATASDTGFVSSHVWIVTETGAPSLAVAGRDLNQRVAGGTTALVGSNERVSGPTDVALLEDAQGTLQKVFVTSFHTDRVVVLTPDPAAPNDPASWASTTIAIPPATGSGYSMAGPRCLAVKQAVSGTAGDPGARVYCLNRIDFTISVIDPATNAHIAKFALQRDPSPPAVKAGRSFLYDAKVSGGGMVSCASCHIDGRLDGLAWRLGSTGATNTGAPIPNALVDGAQGVLAWSQSNSQAPTFFDNKGPMMTQSLQGLLNHPVNTPAQALVTNAPYHWRGDKAQFTDFNEAFVNLMGATNLGTAADPKGLSDVNMGLYRDFINTIMYPPNPEQPHSRSYGTAGELGNPGDVTTGSGLALGLKGYHIQRITQSSLGADETRGRSCVQCHGLPDGSNHRVTVGSPDGAPNLAIPQPIETPNLRGIRAREAIDPTNGSRTATSGLTHPGNPVDISAFIDSGFGLDFPAPALASLKAFVRALDTGMAPIVGFSAEIDGTAGSFNQLIEFEGQANAANAGLVVFAGRGNATLGLFFDVTTNRYFLEGTTLSYTRLDLQNSWLPGDVVIAMATPVGSERRIASATGQRTILTGAAPASITLEPMAPATQWQLVPSLQVNSSPAQGFVFTGLGGTPKSIQAFVDFQTALLGSFGLPTAAAGGQRHEAPRRFRVTGNNIRLGASIELTLPNATYKLEADLHPTTAFLGGRRVWETTLEISPLMLYALLCGGPHTPGVQERLDGTATPIALNPTLNNKYGLRVRNENGTISTLVKQPLRLQ